MLNYFFLVFEKSSIWSRSRKTDFFRLKLKNDFVQPKWIFVLSSRFCKDSLLRFVTSFYTNINFKQLSAILKSSNPKFNEKSYIWELFVCEFTLLRLESVLLSYRRSVQLCLHIVNISYELKRIFLSGSAIIGCFYFKHLTQRDSLENLKLT